MRLHSTPESVKAREVTVLAIIETVAAVGLTTVHDKIILGIADRHVILVL